MQNTAQQKFLKKYLYRLNIDMIFWGHEKYITFLSDIIHLNKITKIKCISNA